MKLKTVWSPSDIRSRLPPHGGLGFLFHATDPGTVHLAFEVTHSGDEDLWSHGPFIGSPIFWENQVIGAHIISPLYADLWAASLAGIRRFREEACGAIFALADECGLSHLGLGALLPFATGHGRDRPSTSAVCVTTGHAATVANIRHMVGLVATHAEVDERELRCLIVGAAGSIGASTARWFAATGLTKLWLLDRGVRTPALAALQSELHQRHPSSSLSVLAYEELDRWPEFDIGIVATNAAAPWMDERLLSRAPVWIDDSHPRAATPQAESAISGRGVYLECYVRGPAGMSQTFPFRLPTARDCYSCFAEVFVCWRERMTTDFVAGYPTLEQIALMDVLLPKHGFQPGPFISKSGHELTQKQLAAAFLRLRSCRP